MSDLAYKSVHARTSSLLYKHTQRMTATYAVSVSCSDWAILVRLLACCSTCCLLLRSNTVLHRLHNDCNCCKWLVMAAMCDWQAVTCSACLACSWARAELLAVEATKVKSRTSRWYWLSTHCFAISCTPCTRQTHTHTETDMSRTHSYPLHTKKLNLQKWIILNELETIYYASVFIIWPPSLLNCIPYAWSVKMKHG